MYGLKRIALIAVSMFFALTGTASATLITSGSNNPLAFSWSYSSSNGVLSGNGSMTFSGFNSSSLSVAISLTNTSLLTSQRLTSFGFGIDPNATSVGFVDASDGGMVGASLNQIPSLATVEVCAFGGNNCSGGGNGGILGGASDSFSIVLGGTWGSSINIAPIGFKYQTGGGSFEFTTGGCSSSQVGGCGTAVPEPSSLPILVLSLLGLLGLASFARRTQMGIPLLNR